MALTHLQYLSGENEYLQRPLLTAKKACQSLFGFRKLIVLPGVLDAPQQQGQWNGCKGEARRTEETLHAIHKISDTKKPIKAGCQKRKPANPKNSHTRKSPLCANGPALFARPMPKPKGPITEMP
jgi:hypothetical protein